MVSSPELHPVATSSAMVNERSLEDREIMAALAALFPADETGGQVEGDPARGS